MFLSSLTPALSFIPSDVYQEDYPDSGDLFYLDSGDLLDDDTLDDDILPSVIQRGEMEDQFCCPESKRRQKQQPQVNWNELNKFLVKLNVPNFIPEEITIKVAGNILLVEGKHQEKQDENGHSYVSRQFTRRYILPDDVDLEQLCSSMDENILTIHAPKKKFQLDGSERVIPIITVGEKK